MTQGGDSLLIKHPVQPEEGGSSPTSPLHLFVTPVAVSVAREFIAAHHSRLPYTQVGPWQIAFGVYQSDDLIGTALWHNCSARGLPQDWRELRRMAIASEAPRNTASLMLAQMCRWFRKNTKTSVVVSYQDAAVHRGTIYKAAGWTPVSISRPRLRNREPLRVGTNRQYRSDANGSAPAASAKIRWQRGLRGQKFEALTPGQIQSAALLRPTR